MLKKLFYIFVIMLFASNSIAANNSNRKSNKNSVPQNTVYVDYYQNFKSIMFSTSDTDKISATFPRLKYLSEFKDGTDVSQSDFINRVVEKPKSIFNFSSGNIYIYLNSIMYFSKNNWSIWINGIKITNLNNNNEEIKVLDISPYLVKLAWTIDIDQWQVINPNNLIPESSYSIKDDKVTLVFSLSPNQSFLPTTNRIMEGKVNDVQIANDFDINNNLNKPQDIKAKKMPDKSTNSMDNLFF